MASKEKDGEREREKLIEGKLYKNGNRLQQLLWKPQSRTWEARLTAVPPQTGTMIGHVGWDGTSQTGTINGHVRWDDWLLPEITQRNTMEQSDELVCCGKKPGNLGTQDCSFSLSL